MKTFILFFLTGVFFSFGCPVMGGPPAGQWVAGELAVSGRETLGGQINYDAATDLLQIRTPGGVRVYSPRQATGFQYFDAATQSIRRFVSLSFPGNRSRRVFFEVVLDGDIQLLRRLRPQSASLMQAALARTESPWYDSQQAYHYYVHADGRSVPESRFYQEVYPRLLAEFPRAIPQFVAQKRLNLFTQQGRFLVLHKYNILRGSEILAAHTR